MNRPPARILIVEDERAQRSALRTFFTKQGWVVDDVATGEEAAAIMETNRFDVLLTDLRLPGVQGTDVVRIAREKDPDIGVLLMTAFASVESAVQALRLGAHDYLLKPLILADVARKIEHLLAHRRLLSENARLRALLQNLSPGAAGAMVARSATMKKLLDVMTRAAQVKTTVLITGETGCGKEVVAQTLHKLSPWAEEPFLGINLAAVPEDMVASQLFGHERGAFTGADRKREGVLRAAGEGCVLLDEIGELPMNVQVQLLRTLETRQVQPLGSDHTSPFEARIIAATHRSLPALVSKGKFREDLFFRLNIVQIHIPPLRERREDIPELARQLIQRHAQRIARPAPTLSPDASQALCQYDWPGNVRELSNVLERALIFADDGEIRPEHLPSEVSHLSSPEAWTLKSALENYERAHIVNTLRLCNDNRRDAAVRLGLPLSTFYRRLERFGIGPGDDFSETKESP